MPGNFRGCSRGIFGLQDWEALRRPGGKQQTVPVARIEPRPGKQENGNGEAVKAQSAGGQTGGKKDPRIGRTIVSKYTYKANKNSPIGKELSTSMMEKLVFVFACPDNEGWWMARNEQGEEGYVPVNYMKLEETHQSSLPWLQNKDLLESKDKKPEPPAEKLEYKGYKSAYDKNGDVNSQPESEYKCDMCDKNFNGPHPYNMHMKSKAHKEMVEYYGSLD